MSSDSSKNISSRGDNSVHEQEVVLTKRANHLTVSLSLSRASKQSQEYKEASRAKMSNGQSGNKIIIKLLSNLDKRISHMKLNERLNYAD